MRYSIYINQAKCLDWGITDLQLASLFGFCYELPSWSTDQIIKDSKIFYWYTRGKIIEEFPLLTTKQDTVYRWLIKLESVGLIELCKVGPKTYMHITAKGRSWNQKETDIHPKNSDTHPNKLGQPSEKYSDSHPTYKCTNSNKHTIDKCEGEKGFSHPPKKTIQERKAEFKQKIIQACKDKNYEKAELRNFFEHWTEHGDQDKKMRFEKEKTFGISRRLSNWFRNKKNWNNTTTSSKIPKVPFIK